MTQEEIYITYHDRIEHYIMGKVGDIYLAQDITSTVFLKIYQKLDGYDEAKAGISTWIYTIANNTVIDYFRTRKVSEEIPEDISCMREIEEDFIREEILEELAEALSSIPVRERDLLVMRYYHGMTLKDIAIKMGLSYANVKIVHAKAINHMRERMDIEDYPF